MDEVVSENTVKLSLYGSEESIVQFPTAEDIIYTNETFTLNWTSTLLQFFEVTEPFSGMGTQLIAEQVWYVSE